MISTFPTYRHLIACIIALAGLASPCIGDDAALAVTFLDRAAASTAFTDETIEPYFSLLQTNEMTAKVSEAIAGETVDAQREHTRAHYAAAVLEFSDAEKQMLTDSVTGLHEIFLREYPKLATYEWRFIKASNKIEGGMPHTRGKCIVLSANVMEGLARMAKQVPPEVAKAQVAALMLHEQLHVIQRINPQPFVDLYTKQWGFIQAVVKQNDWLASLQLVNPDGVDVNWVFPISEADSKRWIQPLVMLKDQPSEGERFTMPRDFRMVAVELQQQDDGYQPKVDDAGSTTLTPLHEVQPYTRIFGGNGNIYHPNEASAELFSQVFIFDFYMKQQPPAKLQAPLDTFRAWLKKHFGDA